MEFELAHKLEDMEFSDILKMLQDLRRNDRDAYAMLEEIVNDL